VSFYCLLAADQFLLLIFLVLFEEVISSFLSKLCLFEVGNLGLHAGVNLVVFQLVEEGEALQADLDCFDAAVLMGWFRYDVFLDIGVLQVLG
jgi:hypothetical protein